MIPKDEKKLSLLCKGEAATISRVESDHKELKSRILSLGLVTGSEVSVVNLAPFGDPMTVEVKGSRISLRKGEADALLVITNA